MDNALLVAHMPTAAMRLKARRIREERLAATYPRGIVEWAEANFLTAHEEEREGRPIQLFPHQKAVLRFAFEVYPKRTGRNLATVIYSTPKKSGKTTVAGMVGRWVAETKGRYQEVYAVANDFDQAKNRAFAAAARSVELAPDYDPGKRVLPGRWRILEKEMVHLPTGSKIKALATDYKGEAGAEPTLTVWTELWGYVSEASRRFWTEMTPTPTRKLSMRWVETYAGFEGESDLLWNLYRLGKDGHRLNADELGDLSAFAEAPNWDSATPCYLNEAANLFMYWDDGEQSHRMPWQTPEYYAEEAAILTSNQYRRLHLDEWASQESEAIPIAWWDACADPVIIPANAATVIALDASVSGDCTALSCVARHPEKPGEVVELGTHIWYPPEGGKMDYRTTITPEVDRLVAERNVVEVAYDPYQLEHWAAEQRDKPKAAWYRAFQQGGERLTADKQTYDLVRDRRLHHTGNAELRTHVQGAASKIPKDEENKLRFVKKSEHAKIDGLVCVSMATAECLRLNL